MKKDFRTKNLLSQFALEPSFIEVYDHVLLGDSDEKHFRTQTAQGEWDRQKREHIANRRDVWELFETPPADPSPRLFCEAGNAIREIWENKLKIDFPSRHFLVCFEYAPPVCDLTFYQALEWQLLVAQEAKTHKGSHRADWRPSLSWKNFVGTDEKV